MVYIKTYLVPGIDFTIIFFTKQYLVLLTMVPRNNNKKVPLFMRLGEGAFETSSKLLSKQNALCYEKGVCCCDADIACG